MPNIQTPPVYMSPPMSVSLGQTLSGQQDEALRKASVDLEASFLSEMLKSAGLGKSREGYGSGGAGEDQFSSFLIQAQAQEIANSGGIGIADAIFNALKESQK